MEYMEQLDKGVNIILKYNVIYTLLIVFIITFIAIPELYDFVFAYFGINKKKDIKEYILYNILYLLIIIYITSKDPRLGILGTILYISVMQKYKLNEINMKLIKLMMENIEQEEKIAKLENTNKNIMNTANKFIDTPTATNILNVLNNEKVQDNVKKIIINSDINNQLNNVSSNLQ
jgi:hypothetical protein